MKSYKERVPGFDEIIFENRNKEYGAYDLRKRYTSATFFSLLGGVTLVVLLTFIIYSGGAKPAAATTGPRWVTLVQDPLIQDPNDLKPDVPEKPKDLPDKNFYAAPIVVNDTSVHGTTLPTNDMMLDSIKNGDVPKNDTLKFYGDPVTVTTDIEPPVFVEEMPVFPGGSTELLKFISATIKYPEEAINNNVDGRVIVKFVVAADGSISRIQIMKSVDPLLDKEAMRVVALLPKWKPGRQNGQPVAVWFSVPVNFKLKRQ